MLTAAKVTLPVIYFGGIYFISFSVEGIKMTKSNFNSSAGGGKNLIFQKYNFAVFGSGCMHYA